MLHYYDVARYLLALAQQEEDSLTHLKMQKLLYYTQGFHLAARGEPLFSESIVAWPHGPVVAEAYECFKPFKATQIPTDYLDSFACAPEQLSSRARGTIEAVYTGFGQFSAWRLRQMTHAEKPWIDAWARGQSTEITHEALRSYFEGRVRRRTT